MTTKKSNKKKTTGRKPRNTGKPAAGHAEAQLTDEDEIEEDEIEDEDLDEVEIEDEESEEEEEFEEEPTPKKKASTAIVAEATTKHVMCRGMENHRCVIAGKPYQIEKDKDIKLPSDVAAILSNARKVMKK